MKQKVRLWVIGFLSMVLFASHVSGQAVEPANGLVAVHLHHGGTVYLPQWVCRLVAYLLFFMLFAFLAYILISYKNSNKKYLDGLEKSLAREKSTHSND